MHGTLISPPNFHLPSAASRRCTVTSASFLFLVLVQPPQIIHQVYRHGSRTDATSKMECFVIVVNGFKPLTIITKCSILDVAAVLDPLLSICPIVSLVSPATLIAVLLCLFVSSSTHFNHSPISGLLQ